MLAICFVVTLLRSLVTASVNATGLWQCDLGAELPHLVGSELERGPSSTDIVCPTRSRSIEIRRLPFGLFHRGEDRLEHRIGVEHGLQSLTREEIPPDLIISSWYVVKPAFGLGQVL